MAAILEVVETQREAQYKYLTVSIFVHLHQSHHQEVETQREAQYKYLTILISPTPISSPCLEFPEFQFHLLYASSSIN